MQCSINSEDKMLSSESNWFLSANFEGEDLTSRFIKKGIWEKNTSDKYDDMVNTIQVGDRVALKVTHNQKENIPFDYKGKIVSVMEIKATGVVIKNYNNGKKISVKWLKTDLNKNWYFFTYMRSIWKVEQNSKNWMCDALLDFTFNEKPQDINRFKNEPYWKSRINSKGKILCENEIFEVLSILGGEAQLSSIQDEIQKRNRLEMIRVNPDWRAVVRFTLQRFSSDSKSFAHGEDLFYRKSFSSDIWGLRDLDMEKKELYSKEHFFSEVYMKTSKYDEIVKLLKEKKSIIVKGAPGLGKSYIADRLVFSLLGEKNKNRVEIVKLNEYFSEQNRLNGNAEKSYNDFLLTEGCFVAFSQKAVEDTGNDYYFIIDGINRENLNTIMGDLILLFKRETQNNQFKRQKKFSVENFYIPENIYILGMMDTADKSMILLDQTLQRHFNFVDLEPAFNCEGFVRYIESKKNVKLNQLVQQVQKLNLEIEKDQSLGSGFQIGHNHFCNLNNVSEGDLLMITTFGIFPKLEEYWSNEETRLQDWKRNLYETIK